MCVKQYVKVFSKGFNVEMKLERFPALLRSVKMGLQSSNMSHSEWWMHFFSALLNRLRQTWNEKQHIWQIIASAFMCLSTLCRTSLLRGWNCVTLKPLLSQINQLTLFLLCGFSVLNPKHMRNHQHAHIEIWLILLKRFDLSMLMRCWA